MEQQLSTWLMLTRDRMPDEAELVMTHELLASLLGVRRERITQAACRLQEQGYIRYRRGHITVTYAEGLAGCTCECYAVVRMETARLARTNTVR